jgi:uncharacterized protein YciI
VELLVYGRDRPGTAELRDELSEAHWAYMDRFADVLIARGPTLTPDLQRATGSLHIVDLADVAAARAFAEEEPYAAAGVFEDVLIRRWNNGLGRTMWQFDGDPEHNRRFLILGHGKPGIGAQRDAHLAEHRRHLDDPAHAGHFIARGGLFSDDGSEWVGSAMLVEFPDRAAAEAMEAADPFVRESLYAAVEIHDWEFGGRR